MKQQWLADWIHAVKAIVRKVYNEDYSCLTPTNQPMSPRKLPPPSGEWASLLQKTPKPPQQRENDELTAFWSSPCEIETTDPLQYWCGVLHGQPESRLARMAIDYLSSPASSVDVEHAFSRGALTVTHRRHALSDSSTRNSIVLGAWLNSSLVPKDDLINFFQSKARRGRELAADTDDADMSDTP